MDNRAGFYFAMVFFAVLVVDVLWVLGNDVWTLIVSRF